MNTAYAVVSGSYSDYRVRAIFTSREKAEMYAKTANDSSVEEFLLDPAPDEKILEIVLSGDRLWRTGMRFNGDGLRELWKVGIDSEYGDSEYGYATVRQIPMGITAIVRAQDADSAIKIMNEYRIRYLHEHPEVLLKGDGH